MNDDGLMGRAQLEQAFTALGDRLVRRGVVADLFIGPPPWWLNEQASAYVSNKHDPGKREVFDHPGIRVMAASEICRAFFPGEELPPRSHAMLEDLFAS